MSSVYDNIESFTKYNCAHCGTGWFTNPTNPPRCPDCGRFVTTRVLQGDKYVEKIDPDLLPLERRLIHQVQEEVKNVQTSMEVNNALIDQLYKKMDGLENRLVKLENRHYRI